MTETQIPWHQFFFDWFGGNLSRERSQSSPSAEYYTAAAFSAVQDALTAYTPDRPERLNAPYFQRRQPETLLIDEIESLWDAIASEDDWSLFHAKLDGIAAKRKALLA